MATKKAPKKVTKTREAIARSVVLQRKDKISSVQPESKARTKARTEEDWLREERAQRPLIKRQPDAINEVVGRDSYQTNAGRDDWELKATKARFTVSRFYWHDSPFPIAYDLPKTEEEMEAKAAVFAEMKVVYLAVAPGESISPVDLAARLHELELAKAKKFKVLQAA